MISFLYSNDSHILDLSIKSALKIRLVLRLSELKGL